MPVIALRQPEKFDLSSMRPAEEELIDLQEVDQALIHVNKKCPRLKVKKCYTEETVKPLCLFY